MENISCEEQLDRLTEKARADASKMLVYISQLHVLLKDNEIAEASVEKRSCELDVKEKELQSVSLDLEKRCQVFEKEKANQDKIVEERSQELDVKEKKLQSVCLDLEKRCQVFETEKANHDKIVEERSQELDVKEKKLQSVCLDLEKRCQVFETEKANHDKIVEERSQELDVKEKKLQSVSLDLEKRCQVFETEKANQEKIVEERSQELDVKEKKLQILSLDLEKRCQVFETEKANHDKIVEERSQELDVKEKKLQSVSLDLEKRCQVFETVKANHDKIVEERSQELDVKEKKLQILSLDLEKRCQVFKKEKAEAGNLIKLVEDCSEELRSKTNELTMTRRELMSSETRLGLVMADLQRHRTEACIAGERKRQMEGEIDQRTIELAQILDRIKESGKQFVTVGEQLESRRRQLGIVSSKLVSKEVELQRVSESIKVSNSDLGLKEKKVVLLTNHIIDCEQAIGKKSKELGGIQKLIEEQTRELDLLKLKIQELLLELLTKGERHKEISQAIDRSSSEMQERDKEIKAAETKASELHARSQRFRQDVEDKKKELDQLTNQIESGEKKLFQLKREMDERAKKIKVAGTEASELNARSQRFREDVEDKEKELGRLKNQIESGEKKLFQLKREIEESDKKFKAAGTEASDLSVKSERFRQEVQGKEKELDQLKNQIESAEKKLIQVNREAEEVTRRKKKVLEMTVSKIQESGKQLVAVNEKLESQKKLLETRAVELVSSDMELECVAESSRRFKFDFEAIEKRLQVLKNLITISSEQLDLKSKELGEVQKLIEEETKKLCDMQKQQPSAAPIIDTSQQNAAEAELVEEDALTHHESAASLVHDVSSALKASPNPAEIVLDLVQDAISKASGLEDSALEILVLLFDEFTKIQQSDQLANIQRPDQSQLQLKATEMATLWKGKITIEAPKSSLEALAFLQFIVAYGLKKMINQEETVLLASSIAHYEQASALFNSLGLEVEMITDIVFELINKSHYIPAIRFICKFKLTEISPSHLLKKEITSLSPSVLEKRPTGCSQAKGKDAGKLSAILHLLADYEELKNDLPENLVTKLMLQRENSTPVVRCSVKHVASSSSPQVNTKSPDLASAQLSSVNLRIPKPEVKPFMNLSGNGRS